MTVTEVVLKIVEGMRKIGVSERHEHMGDDFGVPTIYSHNGTKVYFTHGSVAPVLCMRTESGYDAMLDIEDINKIEVDIPSQELRNVVGATISVYSNHGAMFLKFKRGTWVTINDDMFAWEKQEVRA